MFYNLFMIEALINHMPLERRTKREAKKTWKRNRPRLAALALVGALFTVAWSASENGVIDGLGDTIEVCKGQETGRVVNEDTLTGYASAARGMTYDAQTRRFGKENAEHLQLPEDTTHSLYPISHDTVDQRGEIGCVEANGTFRLNDGGILLESAIDEACHLYYGGARDFCDIIE